MSKPRLEWNNFFMENAILASNQSTCLRRKVGAVLVKDRHILAVGYCGPPRKVPHCVSCIRQNRNIPSGQNHELCRSVHAEQNVIIQAAYHGVSIRDSTLYCTHSPCAICTKMLINAGVKDVYYAAGYVDNLARELACQAGINLINMVDVVIDP